MTLLQQRNSHLLIRLAGVLLALVGAWQVGIYAGRSGITYIEVVVGALAIAGIIIMGKGHEGLRVGYFAWILTLGLGYRTAEVGTELRIHPLFILIFALYLMLLVHKLGEERGSIRIFIPRFLWIWLFFLAWGTFAGLWRGLFNEEVWMVAMSFGVMLPLVVLTYHVVGTPRDWKIAITLFYGVGAFIALMGIIEFLFPGVVGLIPGFFRARADGLDQFGFARALFGFFGSPVATFTCALALPFILVLYTWYTRPPARIALYIGAGIMLFGIYIGGYRSMWVTTAAVFVAVFAVNRNFFRLGVVLALVVVAYLLTPQAGRDRLLSVFAAAQGDFVDTSAEVRYRRATNELTTLFEYPLGLGLSGSGWVHSDILQIAADTGVGGGVAFGLWFLSTLVALARQYWRSRDPFDQALLGGMAVCFVILVFQTVTVLVQLSAPVWFVWALAEVRLERLRMERAPAPYRERLLSAPSAPLMR